MQKAYFCSQAEWLVRFKTKVRWAKVDQVGAKC